jgi:hypothetical protein
MMTRAYRALIATISSTIIVIAGMFFVNAAASGSTPAAYDSGTASCTTDSLGYCNGPTLPFTPNAVTLTVQAPITGSLIPSQAMAQLSASSFRARFLQPSGSAAAKVTVTYSYVTTRGTTPTPTPTPTPTTTPTGTATGTVLANAYITLYGWPDNSPPGAGIWWPSVHTLAGGTGTYADPISLAVGYVGSTPDIPAGTRFYIPNVRKYFIVEDGCAACHATPAGTSIWVDMWTGGNGTNDAAVVTCENSMPVTGKFTVVENPDPNRVVVVGSLYNATTGKCAAQFGG